MITSCLAAAVRTDPRSAAPLELLFTILILMAVVVTAALLIVGVGRWIRRANRGGSAASDELASFKVLYERGEFSQEEYEKIRARLGQKLRQDLKVPPKEAPAAPDPLPGAGAESTIKRPDDQPPGNTETAIRPE